MTVLAPNHEWAHQGWFKGKTFRNSIFKVNRDMNICVPGKFATVNNDNRHTDCPDKMGFWSAKG